MNERLVVDASVVVKWFLPEPGSSKALDLLASGIALLAPDILTLECAHALTKRFRRRELTASDVRLALRHLSEAPVSLFPHVDSIEEAADIVLAHHIAIYDALYLVLAETRGTVLVTADERFVQALALTKYASSIVFLGELDSTR